MGLFCYIFTMSRFVLNTDHGELLTVASKWGVAHPTGYPLFTLVGFLFSKIPVGTVLLRLNLLNAIFVAASLPVLFFSIRNFLIYSSKQDSKQIDLAAFLGAAALGLSITVWSQSSSYEVYSLHLLLISLILFALSRSLIIEREKSEKNWLFLALILGLSFSNHMTTVVVLPGIAFLFFLERGFKKEGFILLVKMISIFIAILTFSYGILWLRASQSPLLNWGDPSNWGSFWRHVSGAQYQVWLFESSEASVDNFRKFLGAWPSEFTYISWGLSILGLTNLFQRHKKLLTFLLILFFGNVFYVINYTIHDLEPYFLLAYVVTAVWIGFGTLFVFQRLLSDGKVQIGIAVLLIAVQAQNGFADLNKSRYDKIEAYSRSALESLPKNSILITRQWDVFNSPAYYLQFVEGVRPDVQIIGKELLRRSWYYDQLEGMYPKTMTRIKPVVEDFRMALVPFENGENYDAALLSRTFQNVFASLIMTNIEQRPVFIGPEILTGDIQGSREFSLPQGVSLFPEDYFLRVTLDQSGKQEFDQNYSYLVSNEKDVYEQMMQTNVNQIRTFQALYLLTLGKRQEAKRIRDEMLRFDRKLVLPPALQNL